MSKEFVLLKGTLPANHIPHMLGRVVVDQEDPLEEFRPYSGDGAGECPDPEEIAGSLCDEDVSSKDLEYLKSSAKTIEAKAKLTKIVDAQLGYTSTNSSEIHAESLTKKRMVQVKLKFLKLMQNEQYRKQVEALRKEHPERKLALVTGMLICQYIKRTEIEDKQTGWLTSLTIPLGKIFALPTTALDPGLEAGASHGDSKRYKAELDQQVIFAVRYDDDIVERYFADAEEAAHRERKLSDHFRHSPHRKPQQNLDSIPVFFSNAASGGGSPAATSEYGDHEDEFWDFSITQISPDHPDNEVERKAEALRSLPTYSADETPDYPLTVVLSD